MPSFCGICKEQVSVLAGMQPTDAPWLAHEKVCRGRSKDVVRTAARELDTADLVCPYREELARAAFISGWLAAMAHADRAGRERDRFPNWSHGPDGR